MSKFKIGDKVNVEYSPNCFIKCKITNDRVCLQNKQTLDDINCKYDTQNEYEYVCMDTGDFKIILDNQTTYLCKRHLLSFLLKSSSMKFIIEKI